jgi:hypothetical protein
MSEEEGLEWACRSLDFAFDHGAAVCSVIPTRGGNGALEALTAARQFEPPSLASMEAALEYGVRLGRGRVFMDLWDANRFAACAACAGDRLARLAEINHTQVAPPPVVCSQCGEGDTGDHARGRA